VDRVERRSGEERRDTGSLIAGLQERVEGQQRELEESRRTRERYVPIIEQTSARVDEMHNTLHKLELYAGNMSATLDELSEKIGPLLSERALVLRFLRFWGGVGVGAGVTVVTSVTVWAVIDWLK
jgi:adenylosuccinate lyase